MFNGTFRPVRARVKYFILFSYEMKQVKILKVFFFTLPMSSCYSEGKKSQMNKKYQKNYWSI